MGKSKIIELNRPENSSKDTLTEIIRSGARRILKEALEVEIETFVQEYKDQYLSDGKRRVVRNGYHQEREIVTGIGKVDVKAPRARDRLGSQADNPIRFTSSILPPYLRKTKSLEELIPWLYLKGISAGDFSEVLTSIIGRDAKGFSQNVVSRLKTKWQDEYDRWCRRDLSKKRYVYLWVDGVHCNVRMDDRQCILVIMGATPEGKKELVAVEGGYRESKQSWREILIDLQHRGLSTDPEVVIGDGALGFWSAVSEVFPNSRWQRCWVHKTANILNKLPKSIQSKAKKKIHEIYMSDTKENAEKAYKLFCKTYRLKYPKAVECLEKDRESLMTFYDFPAEHWKHIRSTNPIESTFATVRLRTYKVRGCFSSRSVVNMAFKLCQSAEKTWRKLSGYKRLAEVIEGVRFIDGISEKDIAA